MPASKDKICPNCRRIFPAKLKYCPACGQKYSSGPVSFWDLLSEAFSVLFNLDNKFFRTFGAIFIPGRLTDRFFAGQRISYVNPMRLLLVSVFVLIFTLNHVIDEAAFDGPDQFFQELERDEWQRLEAVRLDTLKPRIIAAFDGDTVAAAAIDSLLTAAKLRDTRADSINFTPGEYFGVSREFKIAHSDIYEMQADELLDKYGITHFADRLFIGQGMRLIRQGDRLLVYLIGNILWFVLLLLPLCALILKLLYLRRKRYFTEHFVFAAHFHCVGFFLISIYLAFYHADFPLYFGRTLLLICLWQLIAMYRYYGQSKRKTLLKFIIFHILNAFAVTAAFVLTTLLSILLF